MLLLTPNEIKLLSTCPLFCNAEKESIQHMLSLCNAQRISLEKGNYILREGDPVSSFGIVLKGQIHVLRDDLRGRPMLMACVTEGDVFGEALCYLKVRESPIFIQAVTNAKVLLMSMDCLSSIVISEDGLMLFNHVMEMLSRKMLEMNDRIQILSKQGIREKLLAYFSVQKLKSGSNTFVLPLNRTNLAAYLGVNRTALCRTLSLLQKDGTISIDKNTVTIC